MTTFLLPSFFLNLLLCCHSYKLLLLFPFPSRSHRILGEGYVKHLSKAGHEITYVAPSHLNDLPVGVRFIDLSTKTNLLASDITFNVQQLITQQVDLQNPALVLRQTLIFANATLHDDGFQKLLRDPKEEFDAVIVEWMYIEIYSGLAGVFNCPLIWSSSLEPHSMLLSLIDEHLNPAYTTHQLSRDYGFNFLHRVHQLWVMINIRFQKWRIQNDENQAYIDIFESLVAKRGGQLPAYEDVKYNSSLILGNSYISSGEAINLPQNYKDIGGYHIEEERELLPKNLQKNMDSAKYGVIYFSMGTLLRSSQFPENLTRDILTLFGALNQTVIWKFEEALTDLPKNVHILPWAPQASILAHPNCILFISHGGLLSIHETLYFGVPMIGIPQFGDQFININRAERKGFAKRIDLMHDGPTKLDLAIREILGNSSYRENILKYSFIYHHRPISPAKELVHWVEHVIMTRGAMHLRSPSLNLPWYQKYYVDLAAVILLLNVIVVKAYRQGRVICRRYLKKKQK